MISIAMAESFQAEVEPCESAMKHKAFLLPPISSHNPMHLMYLRIFLDERVTPLRSISDYHALYARMASLPKVIEQMIFLLKKGMEDGITYTRKSLSGVDRSLKYLQVPVSK